MSVHIAVDLGASSGRVMAGAAAPGRLELTELHRFPNGPVPLAGGLVTDAVGLWQQVLHGLRAVARAHGDAATVAVDTWAVDYGLLAADGTLLGTPRHYRDPRTGGVAERVLARVPGPDLYARNGLQHLPFTTIYQLLAEADGPLLAAASDVLLLPDLFGFWLSGVRGAEATNASTTGLADVATGRWAPDLAELAGLPAGVLPPVHDPGAVLGGLRPDVLATTGLGASTRLVAVGSHDTASAVVAVPAEDEAFAYVACGTWGLVGVELERPVLSAESFAANFTNERGVDDRIRYLRNVMGLWVLQQCVAEWSADAPVDLADLLAAAAALGPGGPRVDIDDPRFLAPGPMAGRVRRAVAESGGRPPAGPAEVARCVLDSLADAFARTVADAVRLSGHPVRVVHLVGGGARNRLLCQLTANACGLPVVAGPVEATALGNVLVQARAAGDLSGSLEGLRDLVRRTSDLTTHQPEPTTAGAP
ncbi:rhamnulokinase [Kineococcus radiotolerans]|uniref:Carbohydrate kinase FGGY n=1 Tax=Kineococcus radiotolerans (strain ATCC BAA-149 / DSM 14245 / SRS30216) TaxID=266940 RepID=A6W7T4_KINRD|nr:rhamnulokinase family protein [Kineococcus radiotolerans]ABS02873.1 carbohydrate kinase FGGY [Kineococcus radiotolerans SRS30216 = ATCC BAA-149]